MKPARSLRLFHAVIHSRELGEWQCCCLGLAMLQMILLAATLPQVAQHSSEASDIWLECSVQD